MKDSNLTSYKSDIESKLASWALYVDNSLISGLITANCGSGFYFHTRSNTVHLYIQSPYTIDSQKCFCALLELCS